MRRLLFTLSLCTLLAACDRVNPLRLTAGSVDRGFTASATGIHATRAMKNAKDWTKHFTALYPGMMACLNAHPEQPAWATRVVPLKDAKMEVRMQGANGRVLDCIAPQKGGKPELLTEAFGLDFVRPAFFPIAHGKPEEHECLALEPVEKGWFFETIGWIARHRCTPPWEPGEEQVIFDLHLEEKGPVVEATLQGLPEEAIKILAHVTARINTACASGNCALTTALGLGKQCGERHVSAVMQGFGDFSESQCVYTPDGATELIWADDLALRRVEKDVWEIAGNITRADDRGQSGQLFNERYRVGDAGEIVLETSTLDDWH